MAENIHYYICLYIKQLAEAEAGQLFRKNDGRSDNCAKISYTIRSLVSINRLNNNFIHLIKILVEKLDLEVLLTIDEIWPFGSQKETTYRRYIDKKMSSFLQKFLHRLITGQQSPKGGFCFSRSFASRKIDISRLVSARSSGWSSIRNFSVISSSGLLVMKTRTGIF